MSEKHIEQIQNAEGREKIENKNSNI